MSVMEATAPSCRLRLKGKLFLREAESLRYVRDRARFKLGRFRSRIQGLDVKLKDEATLAGERLYLCDLSVHLDSGGPIAVARYAQESLEAFDHALGVAERMVRKALRRGWPR